MQYVFMNIILFDDFIRVFTQIFLKTVFRFNCLMFELSCLLRPAALTVRYRKYKDQAGSQRYSCNWDAIIAHTKTFRCTFVCDSHGIRNDICFCDLHFAIHKVFHNDLKITKKRAHPGCTSALLFPICLYLPVALVAS